MKTRLSEDGTKLIATYELHPFDFDRSGKLPPWKVMQMIGEDCHQVVVSLSQRQLTNQHGFSATRCLQIDFSPDFTGDDVIRPNMELLVTAEHAFIGKTSWGFCGEGFAEDPSTPPILQWYNQMVMLNVETGLPTPLPEWIIPKHMIGSHSRLRPNMVQPFGKTPPETTFKTSLVVMRSGTDAPMYHVNNAQYLRFCLDHAALGATESAYTYFKSDPSGNNRLKKVAALFLGQAREGDRLDVFSWEDKTEANSLKFQIQRVEKAIFQCTVEFYGNDREQRLQSRL